VAHKIELLLPLSKTAQSKPSHKTAKIRPIRSPCSTAAPHVRALDSALTFANKLYLYFWSERGFKNRLVASVTGLGEISPVGKNACNTPIHIRTTF
jgi:hypothetical protein